VKTIVYNWSIPMARLPVASIKTIHSQIEKEWRQQTEFATKTVESIIKIGQLMLKADTEFEKNNDKIGLLEFESGLPFNKSMASKYRQIAKNNALSDLSIAKQLPSSIHSLYELSQIDPKELRKSINSGLVSPEMARGEVAEYTANRKAIAPLGTAGRPRKQSKVLYEDVLTLKVDKSLPIEEREQLVDAISKLANKYPEFQCVLSKSILADKLKHIRAEAEAEFVVLQKQIMSNKSYYLVNLVDRALEAARKNEGIVPARFEWRNRLKTELEIDTSTEVRSSQIYKAAREKGVVSRFLPLKSHSDAIKAHILVMNYCDGKKASLDLLRKMAEGGTSTAQDKREGQRIAKSYLAVMPWAN